MSERGGEKSFAFNKDRATRHSQSLLTRNDIEGTGWREKLRGESKRKPERPAGTNEENRLRRSWEELIFFKTGRASGRHKKYDWFCDSPRKKKIYCLQFHWISHSSQPFTTLSLI